MTTPTKKTKPPRSLTIKELETFIQGLPKDTVDKLRKDQIFRMASTLYIVVQQECPDDETLVQMAEESVIESFDIFMSRGELH